jgi:hypothetical protein
MESPRGGHTDGVVRKLNASNVPLRARFFRRSGVVSASKVADDVLVLESKCQRKCSEGCVNMEFGTAVTERHKP